MLRKLLIAAAATLVLTAPASAALLNEADFGEFGNSYTAPTNFTGYSQIVGQSNGSSDIDYFWFETLLPGTTSLDFVLNNWGNGSNLQIRLSSTPFTMAEWDWKIQEVARAELYANQWSPQSFYSYLIPETFVGPLYGFVRFYSTNSPSTFTLNLVGGRELATAEPVSLPGTLSLFLAALGGLAVARRSSRPQIAA